MQRGEWVLGRPGAAAAVENTESDYAQACTRPRNPTQHFCFWEVRESWEAGLHGFEVNESIRLEATISTSNVHLEPTKCIIPSINIEITIFLSYKVFLTF